MEHPKKIKSVKHIYLSACVLLINFGSVILSDIRIGYFRDASDYFLYFSNMIPFLLYHALATVFLMFSVYLTYKHLPKNKLFQGACVLLIPLIGALIFPGFFYFLSKLFDDRWMGLGATFLLINNAVLYFLNELLLFWNLRKIKKSS